MKTLQPLLLVTALGISILTVTNANAALESRLGGLAVYDTDLNVTWLANANLAATNRFGISSIYITSTGLMNQTTAFNWIGNMNASGYLGFNDWRLPTAQQPDATCSSGSSGGLYGSSGGFGCTGSEMGHLYYIELGGHTLQFTNSAATYGVIANIMQNSEYWTSTDTPLESTRALSFNFGSGSQNIPVKTSSVVRAWAVRSGDVAAVPVPAAAWLLGSGLLSLVGVARRKGT